MPNWCYNEMTIYTDSASNKYNETKKEKIKKMEEQLKDFVKTSIIKSETEESNSLTFQGVVPRPESEEQNWYDWNCLNWGCKWDAGEAFVDIEKDIVRLNFDTAWAPPIQWMEALTKKYPLLKIQNKINEESEAFTGYIMATNGKVNEFIVEPKMPGETV
tara:strand:+ start:85 stop:564 length:480 start_codon:yes stop_codon:yes gene_type:complete